jgi:hypothetical protein
VDLRNLIGDRYLRINDLCVEFGESIGFRGILFMRSKYLLGEAMLIYHY